MKKEFGKWLLDVAKYLATAVVLSSVFGELEKSSIYILGGLSVSSILLLGLFLTSDVKIFKFWKRNN